jgi:acetylornithine deacetylase/succinyl-diaminopimelate desuccinylase-like protein
MTIQTSEKVYLSVRLETKSPGGHSSMPAGENAIDRLAAGLVRLSQLEFPFRSNETTRAYFARLSESATGAAAADLRATAQDPPDLEAARRVAARSALDNAILRTTCVPTRLAAGHADNALPQSARAIVNCRLFPGDAAEFVRDRLVEAVADPQIVVTPLGAGTPPSPVTPLMPEVVSVVERLSQERWPGIPVLPCMDPWSSDSAPLRRAGIATFGVSGTFGELDLGNAHGADERLPARSFDEGVEFLYALMKALTAPERAAR